MVLGIFGVAIALIALTWWWHGRRMKKVRSQAAWPTAEAAIQSSGIREAEEVDYEGARETAYYPEIAFSYAAGGQSHVGKAIQPGAALSYTSQARAQEVCARYPVGGKAKVRYNPAAPSEAYLQIPKADLGMPIIVTIAVVVIAFFAAAA
ncbi:hypothetical protein GCM10007859_07480 [Brevundimonas denitrificans]|uniref:DUF3592 domain-containing protein n=1 Tax=Brevundimonas denitrificans TaxID=1443434 RepID=A0ABQ6BI50_9CAUL|nr:DUF3592 domain-containing protein [Brevundimonas denitrificans]GLS00740.1 hypothetical protein GCM10007859_07480 [Brevundimonas denitrificans]